MSQPEAINEDHPKFMEEGKTQVCHTKGCIFEDVSQEIQITIKTTNEKKRLFLKKCQNCGGKLVIDDLENYE